MNVKKTAQEIRALYRRSCDTQERWKCLKEMDCERLADRKAQFDAYYEDVENFQNSMRVNTDRLKSDPNITKDILIEAFIDAGLMVNAEIWDYLYDRVCGKFCPDLHRKMPYTE